MAGVIETLIVPRLSGFLTAHVTLVASSPISQLSLRRNFVSESRGKKLNINSFRSSRSVRLKSKFSGCGGRIVYEAQETVVQVLPVIDGNWQPLVLESNLPVLVEFWAPWCGPCRMIHPVIDELGKEYTGKLTCYKVNTDESPSIATKYGIRTIPTASSSKMERRRKQLLVQFQEQLCVPALRSFCRGTY